MLLSFLDHHFFFLIIRRPPRSTLFPTRRSSDLPSPWTSSRCWSKAAPLPRTRSSRHSASGPCRSKRNVECRRSEEHTSELQSRFDLVCRLLLEKKNLRNINHFKIVPMCKLLVLI